MTALLKIVDEHFGKGRDPAFTLQLASERITGRELIRRRVSEEIAQINAARVQISNVSRSYLVRLAPVEAKLNAGARQPPRRVELDETEEVAAAIRAFEQNRFILLFDDRQIADLDEEIVVTKTSEMVFLRLVPLVGG